FKLCFRFKTYRRLIRKNSGDWRETLDNWILTVGLAGGDKPQRHKEHKEEDRFKRAAFIA
ncbi:MAG: hypothetical protein ACKPH1_19830, partial [Microcystis panniformis]